MPSQINRGEIWICGHEYLETVEVSSLKQVSTSETVSCDEHSVDESESGNSSSLLEPANCVSNEHKEGLGQFTSEISSQSGISFCPSPQNSCYTATQYMEAKQSFTNTEVSKCANSVEKSGKSGEVSNSGDFVESMKTSTYRGSTESDVSDESSSSSLSRAILQTSQGK
ncbi:D6 protein kinase like 2 [Actinidia rufa]|uniref:D6 protein kinase like 2 n=1 Tax=Actinidia rufa TaxID=165716 RepID=A0A7J0DF03_9ERIC|nr:D6 protein kinase like 2 [Actinidia rufa]